MKRIICLSLCLIMLLSTLVGCKFGNVNDPDDSAANESDNESVAETEIETDEYGQEVQISGIPDELDYGGEEIVLVTRSANQFRREFGLETQKSALDNRIFRRNETVQKELGIKLTILTDPEFDHKSDETAASDIMKYVQTQYNAGIDSVDILGIYAAYVAQHGIRSYLVNLNDDSMKYLDLSKKYWNQTYVDAATIHDQLYYVVGDMNLSVWDRCSVNFVNLDALENAEMTAEELYQLVYDGEWTIEKMTEIVTNAGWLDGGDGGTPSSNDSYGLVYPKWVASTDPYTVAFNLKMINEADDGSLSFNMDQSNLLKIEGAYEKLADLYRLQASYGGASDEVGAMFRAGRSVFWTGLLYQNDEANELLREVGFNYTIVPLPKLEVDDNVPYQVTPIDTYNAMAILNNKDDKTLEVISATLELLNEKSYSDVRPFYIEKIVKVRYVDGGDSVRMLETIFDGITFTKEWVYLYQTGLIASYVWRHVFQAEFAANPKDSSASTQWQEWGSSAEVDLEDLDDFFRELKK